MIAPMEKLFIAGPKRLAPAVLWELQQAGAVQIDPVPRERLSDYRLEPEAEAQLKRWDAVRLAAAHAADLLKLELDAGEAPFPGNLADAEAASSSLEQKAALLVEKRERLKDERQLLDQYAEVLPSLAAAVHGLDASSRLAVIPFLVERQGDLEALEQDFTSALAGLFRLADWQVGHKTMAVIITLKREAAAAASLLRRRGWAELPRPGEYAGLDLRTMAARMAARAGLAPRETAGVEEELRHLAAEAAKPLSSLWSRASNEANRLHTLKALASGRYGMALFGWTPASKRDRVVAALSRLGEEILYLFEPAGEHEAPERIPVTLENPRWLQPFEPLVSFLHTPRYDTLDPTWISATLFPLWFGMVVGDAGYGLVFLGLAGYLSLRARRGQELRLDFFKMRLSPEALGQVVQIMKPMIAWTILFGLLYGEFFGSLLMQLRVLGTRATPGMAPILLPRTDPVATATMLILISIIFGILQVLHGFIIKAQLARRRGERKAFWEAWGYFGGVAALIIFSYAFMSKNYAPWLMAPLLLGIALFLAGMVRAQAPLMLMELPTQGGHILSYLRLYSVGLASAILAELSTDIALACFRAGGIPGIIFGGLAGLVVALTVHGALILLLTISHVLQPLRLLWVEFFTKFDFYNFHGRPYRPFKLVGSQKP